MPIPRYSVQRLSDPVSADLVNRNLDAIKRTLDALCDTAGITSSNAVSLPPIGVPIRYVADPAVGNANDHNDGSERFPKSSVTDAYLSLPSSGGAIVNCGRTYAGGNVSGQGLRFGDGGQQLYPGFLPSKDVQFFGVPQYTVGRFSPPQAEIWPGSPTDSSRPSDRQDVGLWIANNSHAMQFRNILWSQFCVAARLGVSGNPALDPDNVAQRGQNMAVSDVDFDSCTFAIPDSPGGRDIGPCFDGGYFIFDYFHNNRLIGSVGLGTGSSDRQAGMLCKSSASAGTGSAAILRMVNTYAQFGGIIYYVGATDWEMHVDGFLLESDNSQNLPTLVRVVNGSPYGRARLLNLESADTPVVPLLLDNSTHINMPKSRITIGPCGRGDAIGPCTWVGAYRNTDDDPLYLGQQGFCNDKMVAEIDNVRAATPIITNWAKNFVPQHSSADGLTGALLNPPDIIPQTANRTWTQAGASGVFGVTNSPIPDRNGGNTAIRIATNNGSLATQALFYATQNATAGDRWVAAGWARIDSTPTGGPFVLASANPVNATFSAPIPPIRPEYNYRGQWQFQAAYFQCLTSTAGHVDIDFHAEAHPGQPIDIDVNYLCFKVAAGSMSDAEFADRLAYLMQLCQAEVSSAVTQPWQSLIVMGDHLGFKNLVAPSATTTVQKQFKVTDEQGTFVGYVDVKT